jgi:hypothetical protein
MPRSTKTFSETPADTRLETITDVRSRYELAGPHVTVIVRVPTPGTVGDNFDLRWKATKADLHHLGASQNAVEQMDALVVSTERRGHPLLLTANDDSATACWLGFDIEPSMTVGSLPALVPAIRQVTTASCPTVAASVDRIGADVYSVDAFDIGLVATVDGEDEQIHKATSGGWSQKNHQRHSEVLWERNAALVAAEIESQVTRLGADAILLTGDDRAARLVHSDLSQDSVDAVARRQAGGRHEPETVERLRQAVLDERRERTAALIAAELASLREELAQQDRAIDGSIHVLEAIAENRVGTLFVDIVEGRRDTHVDAIVRSALNHGAHMVVGPDLAVRDGLAALLRIPYE